MQIELFQETCDLSIPGLVYQPEFLREDEEIELIRLVRTLPLESAKYKQYVARRRVTSFGGSFDFDTNELKSSAELDARLEPLRQRVALWLELPAAALVHALVAEYSPGTQLGWHRDVPNFELICGVSLGGPATLKFRPYEHAQNVGAFRMQVQPRSIYKMTGDARWKWQHAVDATKDLRWSITFRTARLGAEAAPADIGSLSGR